MKPITPRLLGWLLFGLGVVSATLGLVFAFLDDRVVPNYLNPGGAVLVVAALLWLATGAAIVARQPRNWAGWIFCVIGLSVVTGSAVQGVAVYGLRVNPGSIPVLGLAAWVSEFGLNPVALLPLLFLLFPDGRAPSPRWRWAAAGVLGGTAISSLGFFVRPGTFNNLRSYGIRYENPFGIDALHGVAAVAIGVGTIIALTCSLSTVIALRGRFKRAGGDERQQMRWLVFVASVAGVLFVLTVAAGFSGGLFLKPDETFPIFPILGGTTLTALAIGIPAAYGVAIFRYRLYDLDVVIKKTVVFGLVAGSIAALYALLVGGAGAIVGTTSGPALSFVAAAVVAIGFQPLRARARRVGDRIVYGDRATPYEVLATLAEKMSETYDAEDVLPRMAQILASGSGALAATVWLRLGSELRASATTAEDARVTLSIHGDVLPTFPEGEHAVEVRHQGELLGAISVVMPPNEPMDPSKDKLVRDLAAQAGLVLRNVRLIEELRASRKRLVAAQDEERRKIERNLRDGAQQQLVALTQQLPNVEQLVGRDPQKQRELLARLQVAANEALEDLRDLARGIYPPLLADKGLVAALEGQVRRAAVPTTIDADGIGRYGRDVEAAVYFCALEALNNVAKYAGARAARVKLTAVDGVLTVEVVDDGDGFDPATSGYGTGLQGMADRLDAIGGALQLTSSRGGGTSVRGSVPVPA